MQPESESEKKDLCFFGTMHVDKATKAILVYFVIWNLCLSQFRLPSCTPYLSLIGLFIIVLTLFGVILKNHRLLLPFFYYIISTIFFLLFLGGYFFFANIFFKAKVQEALGRTTEVVSLFFHLIDIICILLHFWQLIIISKCRQYYKTYKIAEKDFELQVPMRSETKEEIA